jgi:hypothetical protein
VCGPSESEINLQNQEASFDQTLQADYAQTFSANQEILSTLNSILQPIAEAGPNQQGYNAQELSTLNSEAINTNAQGVQQAEQAAGQQENALGGGRSFLPSGVNAQINAGIQTAGEENLSQEELGIEQSNFAAGRQNWQNALAGEASIAAGEAPLGYANATTQSNQAAFNEANDINQQSNQEWSDILGGITGGILGTSGGNGSGNVASGVANAASDALFAIGL